MDVPFPVHALDSQPLGSGIIREVTAPLGILTQGGHTKRISLFLIDSPAIPVVLGLPWLARHDPTISWQQRALTGWSRECSGRCLGVSVGATTVESPDQVSFPPNMPIWLSPSPKRMQLNYHPIDGAIVREISW